MTSSNKELKALYAILRNDLYSFLRKAFHTVSPGVEYLDNWHIEAIAYALERCITGEINRLVITMPPRYMKSICASVALPAFLLGRDPTARIICASYSKELAHKHAADSQMVMASDWYARAFPETAKSLKTMTQSELVTTLNGSRLATSVGGMLTGRGGNWLIIDDPHKADEVHSDKLRQSVIDWFEQVAATRLDDKDKGVIIVIQQRLHQGDLAGVVLDKGHYYHLNLAAIAEEEVEIPIGPEKFVHRRCDDILHPARHSLEDLMQLKLEMGEYAFASQYQQRPSPLGGGLVKWSWFNTYHWMKHPMHAEYVVQSWDTATTAEQHSDWTVCTTWHVREGNCYLVDLHRAKHEFPELRAKVFELAKVHDATLVLIETVGAGRSLHQEIEKELRRMDRPFHLGDYIPKDDKATRLMAEAVTIEQGRIYVPEQAAWLDCFKQELLDFPNGLNDDQVDSLTMFLRWARFNYYSGHRSAAAFG